MVIVSVPSIRKQAHDPRPFSKILLPFIECAGDEEVHRVLQEKVFPRQADVITSDEALRQLE